MDLKPLPALIFLSIAIAGYAQNISTNKHSYEYQMVRLDSTYDSKIDRKLQQYVDKKRHRMERKMQEVIYRTDAELESYPPESPLSNLLTDILRTGAPKYTKDTAFDTIDVAVLNFGGIRTSMPAGDVTVGDIYKISPFDNYITYILLKGSELRKMLGRFTTNFNAPYSGAVMTYAEGRPSGIMVRGKPIDDSKDYRIATLNFISDGGDNIMTGIKFDKTEHTTITFRDFLIAELKALTAAGKQMPAATDGRAVNF